MVKQLAWITIAAACIYLYLAQHGLEILFSNLSAIIPGQERGLPDYYQYWASARDHRNGHNLYRNLGNTCVDHEAHLGNVTITKKYLLPLNVYPPFTTLIFLPLSYLDYSSGVDVWLLLSVSFIVASVVIMARELISPQNRWTRIVAIAGALLIVGGSSSLQIELVNGNVNPLLLLLLTLAWSAERRGFFMLAGFFGAVVFLIKLFPGLLLVYFFLVNRRAFWSMVAWSMVFGMITLATFGWQNYALFFTVVIPEQSLAVATPYNYSISGFWHRLFLGREHNDGDIVPLVYAPVIAKALSMLSCLAIIVSLVAVRAVGWVSTGRTDNEAQPGPTDRDVCFAATVTAMALMSPVTWRYTLIILVLPLFIIWCRPAKNLIVTITLVGLTIILWLHPTVWEVRLHSSETHSNVLPWDSLTHLALKTYAVLLLFVLTILSLRANATKLALRPLVEARAGTE